MSPRFMARACGECDVLSVESRAALGRERGVSKRWAVHPAGHRCCCARRELPLCHGPRSEPAPAPCILCEEGVGCCRPWCPRAGPEAAQPEPPAHPDCMAQGKATQGVPIQRKCCGSSRFGSRWSLWGSRDLCDPGTRATWLCGQACQGSLPRWPSGGVRWVLPGSPCLKTCRVWGCAVFRPLHTLLFP